MADKSDIPNIDIVVERQWHVGSLAHAFLGLNCLGNIYGGFPADKYERLEIPSSKIRSSPFPALFNYGMAQLKAPRCFRMNESHALAKFAASYSDLNSIIVCFATVYQYLFPLLLDSPIIRVIECGSMYPEDHFTFPQQGRREAGLSYQTEIPSQVREEIEVSKLAHFLICGSKTVAESYVRRGYNSNRVLHCPYGVHTDFFTPSNVSRKPLDPLRIATVGCIGIRKGIHRIILISEWMNQAGYECEFVLIGPIEPEARKLLSNSRARYRELGILKGIDLVKALRDCDLYCLPSYEEGFPISLLEAMATGLPVITSRHTGGYEAVSDGVNGVILEKFTPDEFEKKLPSWLKNPQLRRNASILARQKAQTEYSLSAYYKRVKETYEKIISITANEKILNCFSTAFAIEKSM